jgi:hypothetical protein
MHIELNHAPKCPAVTADADIRCAIIMDGHIRFSVDRFVTEDQSLRLNRSRHVFLQQSLCHKNTPSLFETEASVLIASPTRNRPAIEIILVQTIETAVFDLSIVTIDNKNIRLSVGHD